MPLCKGINSKQTLEFMLHIWCEVHCILFSNRKVPEKSKSNRPPGFPDKPQAAIDYLPALMFHVDGKFQVLESFVKDEFDKHQIEQVCWSSF